MGAGQYHRLGRRHHLPARRSHGNPAGRHQENPRLLHPFTTRLHGYGRRPCSIRNAGMFHLFTHAWFKALLFLGSGAVIYACHHEQNIWKMGDLRSKMPITTVTFFIGTLALCGFPLHRSVSSPRKRILEAALQQKHRAVSSSLPSSPALTTFYMFRLFFIAFLGKSRSDKAGHAKEVGAFDAHVPLIMLERSMALDFRLPPNRCPINLHQPASPRRSVPYGSCAHRSSTILRGRSSGSGFACKLYYRTPPKDPLADHKESPSSSATSSTSMRSYAKVDGLRPGHRGGLRPLSSMSWSSADLLVGGFSRAAGGDRSHSSDPHPVRKSSRRTPALFGLGVIIESSISRSSSHEPVSSFSSPSSQPSPSLCGGKARITALATRAAALNPNFLGLGSVFSWQARRLGSMSLRGPHAHPASTSPSASTMASASSCCFSASSFSSCRQSCHGRCSGRQREALVWSSSLLIGAGAHWRLPLD